MYTEIPRSQWGRTLKKLNAANQLRQTVITLDRPEKTDIEQHDNVLFMGLTLRKKGRVIDGIELWAATPRPDHVVEPIAVVNEPARLIVEENEQLETERLVIESSDGTVASLSLTKAEPDMNFSHLVRQIAYSMYEQRGYANGDDINDWLEAERRVKEAELQFVEK
jgi:hypothetical protein